MNEKIYITNEPIQVKAIYSEPVYDEAPYMGSYCRNVNPTIPKNTRLIIDEKGFLKDVVGADLTARYGVSVHEGTITFLENVNSLIGTKIKIVTEEEWDKIEERQRLYRENYHAWLEEWDTCESIDIRQGLALADALQKPVISADEYEKASAILYESAFAYVKHMTLAVEAAAKMKEYRV